MELPEHTSHLLVGVSLGAGHSHREDGAQAEGRDEQILWVIVISSLGTFLELKLVQQFVAEEVTGLGHLKQSFRAAAGNFGLLSSICRSDYHRQ